MALFAYRNCVMWFARQPHRIQSNDRPEQRYTFTMDFLCNVWRYHYATANTTMYSLTAVAKFHANFFISFSSLPLMKAYEIHLATNKRFANECTTKQTVEQATRARFMFSLKVVFVSIYCCFFIVLEKRLLLSFNVHTFCTFFEQLNHRNELLDCFMLFVQLPFTWSKMRRPFIVSGQIPRKKCIPKMSF